MVVNEKIGIKIDTIIIASILACLVFNICGNLFDLSRTSSIISVSYLVTLFCIRTIIFRTRKRVRIQIPDILVVCYFVFSAIKNNTDFNLNQLGDVTILLLYFYIRMTDKLDYRILYITILSLTFALSLYGYFQYVGVLSVLNKRYLVTGPFYNPAPYGALICFLISIVTTVITTLSKKTYIYLSLCTIIFAIPALILSGSRAAWLGSSIVLVVLLLLKNKDKLQTMSKVTHCLCVISAFMIFGLFSMLLYNMNPESVKGRLLIWKISSEMIREAPITGLGYNGFEANYMNYQREYFEQGKGNKNEKILAGNVVSAYNEPMRIVIEYGFIGLSIYLLLVYFILCRTQQQDSVSLASKMIILGYMLFGLFSYPNRIFSLQVIAILSIACLLNKQKNEVKYAVWFKSKYQAIIMRIASACILVGLLFNTIRFHYAYQKFQALLETDKTNLLEKLDELESILKGDYLFLQNDCILTKNFIEDKVLHEKLNKAIALSPSNTLYRMKGDCLYWNKQYENAEQIYWIAYYMVPSNQKARARIAMMYFNQGKKKEAKQLASSILDEKIKSNGLDAYLLRQEMKDILSAH